MAKKEKQPPMWIRKKNDQGKYEYILSVKHDKEWFAKVYKDSGSYWFTIGKRKAVFPINKHLTYHFSEPTTFKKAKEKALEWIEDNKLKELQSQSSSFSINPNVRLGALAKGMARQDKINEKLDLTREEKRKVMMRSIGLFASHVGKMILENNGCVVDFKINGENIDKLKELLPLDLRERIELAVKEERYEDAAKLKKLLDTKPKDEQNTKS